MINRNAKFIDYFVHEEMKHCEIQDKSDFIHGKYNYGDTSPACFPEDMRDAFDSTDIFL